MDEILSRDQNHVTVLGAVTNDSDQDIRMLRVDPLTGRLLIAADFSGAAVTSLNGLTGAINLIEGSNITITVVGNDIEIAASGGGGGTPGGADTNVQYNDGGSFGGDSNFTWDKNNLIFKVGDIASNDLFLIVSDQDDFIQLQAKDVILGDGEGLGNSTSIIIDDITSNIEIISSTITINGAYTLTTSDGNAGEILTTDGAGSATWQPNTPAVGSITGLGTGVATFLATPSSANLLAAVTDETGTGALMFATSPTITTSLVMADAANFVFNTTTGTKIGTGLTQKLAFYNSTPIVQPTGSVITALQNLGLVSSATITSNYVIQGATLEFSPAANTTYNFGYSNQAPQSAAAARRTPIKVPKSGTIVAIYLDAYVRSQLATAGQTVAYTFTINNAGSTSIGSAGMSARHNAVSVTGLSNAVTAGDEIEIIAVTPAVWTVSATNVTFDVTILIEYPSA